MRGSSNGVTSGTVRAVSADLYDREDAELSKPRKTARSSHFTTKDLDRGIWPSGILVPPGLNRSNSLESCAPWLTTGPGPAYQVMAPQVGGPEGTPLPRASMPDRDLMSSLGPGVSIIEGSPAAFPSGSSYRPSHLASGHFRVPDRLVCRSVGYRGAECFPNPYNRLPQTGNFTGANQPS